MNSQLSFSKVRLIASPKSWIEGEAVRQLYATGKFDGMRLAVGSAPCRTTLFIR